VWIAALAAAILACDAVPLVTGPKPVNDIMQFQAQLAPPGVAAEPALAIARAAVDGIDREFGVDVSRHPDVLDFGIASCSEAPSCLGADAGSGPWAVWHIRWQPEARGPWIALLLDPTTGESIWIGADGAS
jgi:hypothetical protein